MSMDNKGRDMATYFLRDKIYSNKIKAVVREYVCNAVDEHNKYDVDRPVEVALTATDDNEIIFSVRDFALGLSDDGVRKIFGMYFKSTKSDTNDSIGGFGVGSKAGHAYTDTFNIISHYDGVKTSYSCMLGAGDHGVPVGHIYKLDECPTDETGIEINLLVSSENRNTNGWGSPKKDVDSFKTEILSFVQYAHSPIKAKIYSSEYCTPAPIKSVEFDGFTISLVDKFTEEKDHYNGGKYEKALVDAGVTNAAIKMGDVVYDDLSYNGGIFSYNNKAVTITAPVGAFDIPISRENLEDTERNNRTMEKLKGAFYKAVSQDIEKFKTLSLTELLDKHNGDGLSDFKKNEGEFFEYSMAYVFGDTFDMMKSILNVTPDDCLEEVKDLTKDSKTGKPILVTIPNNRASDTWRKKLIQYCTENNVKYMGIEEQSAYPQEITDVFHILKHKSTLKFKKAVGKTTRAAIYYCGEKYDTLSSLEFHNFLRKRNSLSEAKTMEEAKKQNDEFAKNCDNAKTLGEFVLSSEKGGRVYNRTNSFFIGSKVLLKELKEIGIMQPSNDNAIYVRTEKIKESNTRKNETASYVERYCNMPFINTRTKNLIKKNNEKVWKLVELFKALKEENSLRAKIVKEFHTDQYYFRDCHKMPRADWRRILKLK